jgi:hypothetical protein
VLLVPTVAFCVSGVVFDSGVHDALPQDGIR